MASVLVVTDADGERAPLLQDPNPEHSGGQLEYSSPPKSNDSKQRLVSLDAFRGITVAINCRLRGSLEPPCNAVGYIDRIILGVQHLYQRPLYRRTKECSVNSPDYGPLPPNSPAWFLAPFVPEGILSSLMAAVTCFVVLHYGHILVHCKDHTQRVDIKCIRKPTVIFQWMGMNAMIVYALASCEIFPAALQGFYWRTREYNLVDLTEKLLQSVFDSKKWGTLAFVLVEILFWGVFSGFLHMRRIYIKL